MVSIRRWILVSIVFSTACDAGIARVHRGALEHGRAVAQSWIAGSHAVDAPAPAVIAAGYLERLRLGLGSPFRLADHARQDPRLGPTERNDLAWAILARTLDRAAYEIDPVVLDGIAPRGAAAGIGALHLVQIERAIRDADDPRAGELAVRRAYALGAQEGRLDAAAPELSARVAALIRDRELARRDVHALLVAAHTTDTDPLVLLGTWRSERRFAVEAPPLQSRTVELERQALEIAGRLVPVLENLDDAAAGALPAERVEPLLSPAAAARLAALADSANAPPQPPVAVAVADGRKALLEDPGLTEAARQQRMRFVDAALSEERFAAAHAQLDEAGRTAAASTALAAAVSLRTHAQEPVWFPGFAGPSVQDLKERHGLDVAFAPDVPPDWQPYYARLLDLALADLVRVMPALDVAGLRVIVTSRHAYRGTLAVHEPRRRRIVLPPESAAGALAHEIAHDLDWQLALGRYDIRGDYASDAAARGANDPLARRLRDLAAAYPDPSGDRAESHANRPTEVFARSVEWYVAVALAAQDRSNGYLTSIQDELLKGYGSARPPGASGVAGEALIAILDEVAPLPLASRAAYLARYGRAPALTPAELVARATGSAARQTTSR